MTVARIAPPEAYHELTARVHPHADLSDRPMWHDYVLRVVFGLTGAKAPPRYLFDLTDGKLTVRSAAMRPQTDRISMGDPVVMTTPATRSYPNRFAVGHVCDFHVALDVRFDVPQGTPGWVRNKKTVEWLAAHGAAGGGFEVVGGQDGLSVETTPDQAWFVVKRLPDNQVVKHRAIVVAGMLRVLDPDLMALAMTNGIGRSKAFGCGMLILK